MPGGGEPSALRWMAAGAEFPCGVPGGCVASALRWMRCGGVWDWWCGGCVVGECGIGGVVDALWGRGVESALWWIQWVLAVFVEGFLLTFVGGVVILKIHIWEHSGPFGYLIPIWLVV